MRIYVMEGYLSRRAMFPRLIRKVMVISNHTFRHAVFVDNLNSKCLMI